MCGPPSLRNEESWKRTSTTASSRQTRTSPSRRTATSGSSTPPTETGRPFIRRDEKRGDLYVIPGQDNMTVPMGLVAAAGEESSQMTFNGRDFEDWHRSGWDPTYRLNDQARDGVAAELLFATVGMQLCGHEDLDYRRACMTAYNRWLQEYCSHAPDRLFGAGQAARQERRRRGRRVG